MLIRTLLLVIFLISSALSVCVAEPILTSVSSSDRVESITMPADSSDVVESATLPASPSKIASEQAMTMEEALEHVTISTEDWLDGNTYYIRYTFTNPTDVAIDKKVDLTTVLYERCSIINDDATIIYDSPAKKDTLPWTEQCSDMIKRLVIPPFSSSKYIIALPQYRPTIFNQIRYNTFFFADGTQLYYSQDFPFKPISDSPFELSPWISDENELYLTIRNTSFFKTILQADNLYTTLHTLRGYQIVSANKNIDISINPQETKTIYLFTLPAELIEDNGENNPIFMKETKFYQDLHIPFAMDLRIALRLNHIPHLYLGTLNAQLPFSTLQGTTSVNLYETHYFARMHNTPSPHKCVYYLDANHLYGYLPLKNCSTIPIHEPAAKYDLTLTYFTHDTYSKRTNIKLVLPTDFSLQPNEIKYFSFKIPLPDDCYRIAPTSILRPKAKWQTDSYTLVSLNLYPLKKQLSSAQQEDYLPITAEYCPLRN